MRHVLNAVIPAKAGIHAPHEPVHAKRTLAEGEGADPRVPFSLVTFFWASKERNRPPWMAHESHTEVSRLSRRPEHHEQKQMDSGFRRNDGVVEPIPPTLPLNGKAEDLPRGAGAKA